MANYKCRARPLANTRISIDKQHPGLQENDGADGQGQGQAKSQEAEASEADEHDLHEESLFRSCLLHGRGRLQEF